MPALEDDKHLPEAHVRNRSTDSDAVTATGTTCFAASLRETSSSAANLQHDLISAPVQSTSLGLLWDLRPYCPRYISQIFAFSLVLGRSRKKMPSKRSARLNSGGSLLMSLHVPMKNTSLWWSDSQVSSEPNNLADTPESVEPLDATP